jgi:iduronate 2-sulfatase
MMKSSYRVSFLLLSAALTSFGASTPPQRPNVLFLCIDDLRPELKSFGAEYIHSPNIDRLAEQGRAFFRHYVNAPSCGPSRYTLLTGRYGPADNGALFKRAEKVKQSPEEIPPTMPEWFRTHGYTTVAVGKVSHHPGGLGGADWNDPNEIEMPDAWDRALMPVGEWEHPRGAMHGLANGEIREKGRDMDVFQSAPGGDEIYPDGLIAKEGIQQLEELAANPDKPFFLVIGLLKPHLPFGAPEKYMQFYEGVTLPPIPHPEKPGGATTWHKSGEFMGYNRWGNDPREDAEFADEVRKHYAACVSYSDKHVGDIIAKLRETGADKNTVIILWGDHGWHLGEHAIWGKHSLFEEALRSPLIVAYPGLKQPGEKTDAVVSTVDLFPTLCELTGLPVPDFAQGTSLLPQLNNPQAEGHAAVGYWKGAKALRTDRYRLILHNDETTELYDHNSPETETVNVSDSNTAAVNELSTKLAEKLK